ncbi:MAG: oxidoreductase [Planctomyces sp.]|nr:oxidoreductase [Planctomyces sp.]
MSNLHLPWLELSILTPLVGVLLVNLFRNRETAWQIATGICFLTVFLAFGELIDFMLLGAFEAHDHWPLQQFVFNRDVFVVDELSAFLLPLAAVIYLVTVLSTLKTKAPRFSLAWALVSESLVLATFSCRASWTLVALLAISIIPPYLELRWRNRCTRVYAIHMIVYLALLLVGYTWLGFVDPHSASALFPGALLTGAILMRAGIAPFHLWITDLFEKATFGTAITYLTPLTGAYAVMRMVLPIAPTWALQSIAVLSLITAVYAAGMALVQTEARRMFCYLLLSQSSLVLVGLELATAVGLTGALCVWMSVGLSMTGFGITLRCVESRISRVSLQDYHGLYRQMPVLAGFFLLTGLAAIGFPATVGFVGMELLIEGAVEVYPLVGTFVVLSAALNGIAVLGAYFRIFTGRENPTLVPMNVRFTERTAVVLLTLLIVGGGLLPQPGVASRYHAATELISQRLRNPNATDGELTETEGHRHQATDSNPPPSPETKTDEKGSDQ